MSFGQMGLKWFSFEWTKDHSIEDLFLLSLKTNSIAYWMHWTAFESIHAQNHNNGLNPLVIQTRVNVDKFELAIAL